MKITLKKFINLPFNNGYISHGKIHCYVRKAHRYIDDKSYYAFDVANISAKNRTCNFYKNGTCPTGIIYKRTGDLKRFLKAVEKIAKQNAFEAVFVESVINEFLPDALSRYGYHQVNLHSGTICYAKIFN